MAVLITGGSGMLGRNVKEVAAARGLHVMSPSSTELNLLSRSCAKRWLTEHRPDLIIHCAGKVGGIQANIADPFGFLIENSDMGLNLVWAANAVGIPRLLNVGSSCMYPHSASNPLIEQSILTGPLEPTNEGYALAKVLTAKACEYITAASTERIYRTVIPCNLYGRYDHFEPERSHLVPAAIRKVHEAYRTSAPSIVLWGDGTARREFMFARDAARIILDAAERICELPQYMNVGLGRDYSVLEYYAAAATTVGWTGRYEFDLTKPTGMKQKLVDNSRQVAFGFESRTSLEDGLRETYDYFKGIDHAT